MLLISCTKHFLHLIFPSLLCILLLNLDIINRYIVICWKFGLALASSYLIFNFLAPVSRVCFSPNRSISAISSASLVLSSISFSFDDFVSFEDLEPLKDLDLPLLLLLLLLLLEELLDDCFFCDIFLKQTCIFLLNENAWASILSNHSSSCCLSSSYSSPLYSSCTLSSILMRLLNWPSSSSTMTAFRLEKSGSSVVLCFLISLPLTFLLLSFNVCNLYAAPFSVRFPGTPILIPSSSYVMTFCLIHFEKVLIPVKLLVLQLSDVCCTVGKASWVFWASYSSKFSFNLTAINILFTSLTKFFSFIYSCVTAL